jgi:cyanate permease
MNMGAQAGGALTAVSTPLIAAHFGWTASFLTSASLCFAGSILWLAINPDSTLSPGETLP